MGYRGGMRRMRHRCAAGSRGRRPTGRCAGAKVALLLALAAPFTAVHGQPSVRTAAPDSLPVDSVLVAALPARPVWDIDVRSYETRERVQHFIGLFSGKVREEFAKSLQRQTRYDAIIRQKLREGGLPEDMTYLALIESRSEDHTSELQSRQYLVCRLLLEKK